MLHATNITKDFPGGRVLDHVSFSLAEGETLGIIGENGAGKSTLVKILSGIYAATEGSLAIDGVPLHCGSRGLSLRGTKQSPSIAEAQHAGIALVPQEFNLIPELAVFENVFLGRELKTTFGFLDKKTMRERTRAALRRLDSTLSPDALVRTLSVAQRQMTELAKALTRQCRVLILDEPTTVLSAHETECLFGQVRQLNAQGVSAILISHRLHDIQSLCHRVLVLRDGQHICTEPVHSLTQADMARRMVGRDLKDVFPPKRGGGQTPPLLHITNLSARHGYPKDVSLSLHAGEILGLAGLAGSGRTELAETILGLRPIAHGGIVVGASSSVCPPTPVGADLCVRPGAHTGAPLHKRSPRDAMQHGIAYLSEDRQGAGVLLPFDIPSNITLSSLRRYAKPLLDRNAIAATSRSYVANFNIRSRGASPLVSQLSGGNQQKVSLAKCLDTRPKILIVDEPTRGVDINAKHEIYALLRDLTTRGMAILLISSEMEEIVGLSDRVAVMRDGRIAATLDGPSITEEAIILHATGTTD